MSAVTISGIERMIFVIRGQKVMLDSDLAQLYDVPTKVFNQAVRRNSERFPEDFMFQLSEMEFYELRNLTGPGARFGGRRYSPYAFTEYGVAMLSSVLNRDRAAQINISIIRTFIKLRSFYALESALAERVGKFEKNTQQIFKIVFERLDSLEEGLPEHPQDRKRIGIKNRQLES